MVGLLSRFRFASVMVLGSVLITQAGRGVFAAKHVELPGPTLAVEYVLIASVIGYWFEVDNRGTRFMHVWDQGWFVCMGFPFLLPYYLIKTRGWRRGASATFAFLVFYIVAFLVGSVLTKIVD